MLVVKIVVNFCDAVVTVAGGRRRAKKVIGRGSQACDGSGPQTGDSTRVAGIQRAKKILRNGADGHAIGIEKSQGISNPGCRRLGSQSRKSNDVLLFFEPHEVKG